MCSSDLRLGERLANHAGSKVVMQSPPFLDEMSLLVTVAGRLAPGESDAAPDLRVTIKPGSVPLLLARHADAMNGIELSGNAGLAATVQHLLANLDWDMEEDLSRVVGDVAAHRMTRAGRGLLAWQREAFDRTAQNVAEYLVEENPMLVRPAEARQWRLNVQALEQDATAIEKRVAALLRRAGSTTD